MRRARQRATSGRFRIDMRAIDGSNRPFVFPFLTGKAHNSDHDDHTRVRHRGADSVGTAHRGSASRLLERARASRAGRVLHAQGARARADGDRGTDTARDRMDDPRVAPRAGGLRRGRRRAAGGDAGDPGGSAVAGKGAGKPPRALEESASLPRDARWPAGARGFAVVSLSTSTVIYKGLLSPAELPVFYPDRAIRRSGAVRGAARNSARGPRALVDGAAAARSRTTAS